MRHRTHLCAMQCVEEGGIVEGRSYIVEMGRGVKGTRGVAVVEVVVFVGVVWVGGVENLSVVLSCWCG